MTNWKQLTNKDNNQSSMVIHSNWWEIEQRRKSDDFSVGRKVMGNWWVWISQHRIKTDYLAK